MSLKMKIDMGGLADTIGTVYAAEDISHDPTFLGKLIDSAYNKVSTEFNRQVVATALAGGGLKHMFEWGTLGINRGRSTLNPNNPAAQLWQNVITGTGGSRTLTFVFKPSVQPVPLPTTKNTRISSSVLKMLNGRHVFASKASVMEAGAPVHIAPKNGRFLFIPFYNDEESYSGNERDNKRGYTFTAKSITVVPGARSQGTFTSFWQNFWMERGATALEAAVEARFQAIVDEELLAAQTRKVSFGTGSGAAFSGRVHQVEGSAGARMRAKAMRNVK